MKNKIAITLAVVALLAGTSFGQELKGKKVFYINSYHTGYSWSDGIEAGMQGVLKPTGVEFKGAALDTLRDKSPEHLTQAVADCQKTITEWKPDVVIVSDDVAMKAVYAPLFKDKDVPFVFCGVNWDASAYGVPNKNVTGMLEVCPIKDLLAEMNKLKAGKTLGFLAADSLTPRKDGEKLAQILGVEIQTVYAADFAAWKQGYLDLQSKTELLLIGPNAGIAGWDEAEARKFVEENAKGVTGSYQDFLNGVALVSYNKLPAEQGEWAAKAAIQIMKGAAAGSIPVASNQKGELVINARIAKKAGITPSFETLQSAKVIE